MSPAMGIAGTDQNKNENDSLEIQYQKGVKHLCDNGISKVPNKYVLPVSERPSLENGGPDAADPNLKLPVIDFAELQGSNRSQVLKSLANACKDYGFFQLVNHGIPSDSMSNMIEVSQRFFDLPMEERAKYMTSDMYSPVRYGTSFNQTKDGVFSWRDFLKLICHPLPNVLPHWPSSPVDFRELVVAYSKETKHLFVTLMEGILESLGLREDAEEKTRQEDEDDDIVEKFQDGSQLMVVNCYPPCPEPQLTLGMPPHSDYGFLTLVLQDHIQGLQIQFQGKWFTVEPLPNSFVVNVGDHLEIFSNGQYKSVLHRVVVNSAKRRISVASLHSLPFQCMVKPDPRLINQENPRRYKDTDFATFLDYISSCEPKSKNFLDSRKLTC